MSIDRHKHLMQDEIKKEDKTAVPPSENELSLPQNYQIIKTLGHGSMGVVLHVLDKLLDKEYAIKLILSERASESQLQERFLREGKTLAKLNHPNIVKLYRLEFNGLAQPFMVMEYLEGEPLSSLFQEEMQANKFANVFSGVCAGLLHAHEMGVVHRDLKPDNILICKSDTSLCPKIIDFGIATLQEMAAASGRLTGTSKILGTPAYMSPEQCRGEIADQKSDVYSLGCIMYQALSGSPPFVGETALETLHLKLNADFQKLGERPASSSMKELANTIDLCLSANKMDRPDVSELLNVLRRFDQANTASKNIKMAPSAQKITQNKNILIACFLSAGLLIVAASFASTSWLRHISESKQRASTVISLKKSDGTESIQDLQRKLHNLERSYRLASNKESKGEIVHSILVCAKRLADKYGFQQHYHDAATLLISLNTYANEADDKDFMLAGIYSRVAGFLRREGKLSAAKEYVTKAWQYQQSSHTDSPLDASSTLLEMSMIDLRLGHNKAAFNEFMKAKQLQLDNNVQAEFYVGAVNVLDRNKNDSRTGMCYEVFHELKKARQTDETTGLEFRAELLDYFVRRRSSYAREIAADTIDFLKHSPKAGEKAAKRASEVLESYASFIEKTKTN